MEIPLFPLPDLVLFPSVAIPLHIFEERYKQMIRECIDSSSVFGIVMLRDGGENEQTICRTGTTARVVTAERMDDGRMNIICRSEERFRVLHFAGRSPFWQAEIATFEDELSDSDLTGLAGRATALYRQMYELSNKLGGEEPSELVFPASPGDISFMLAYLVDIEPEQKQILLESVSTEMRLNTIVEYLELTVNKLSKTLTQRETAKKIGGNGSLLH